MITQLKEGKWHLEDDTGSVQLDLSRANFHTGLFTECCFVLAEGWYEDGIFHANAFGLPPAERAADTRAIFGDVNFFGGPLQTCARSHEKLVKYENENDANMFVFISDVWLDDLNVIKKLRVLFEGFVEAPPYCFVLIGSFLSKSYGVRQSQVFVDCLKGLTDLVCEHQPLAKESRFVFVPSLSDIGPAQILPRPPIPECLTEYAREKLTQCSFASNPCRIQYCSQEMVIFREDLVMRMCRNCVRFPTDAHLPTHFSKTIVAQAHLCPLPLHVEPVFWAHDDALRLYPLPDLIVCADKYDPYKEEQLGCNVINPGSFPRSDWSFKCYVPAQRLIEDSQILEPS